MPTSPHHVPPVNIRFRLIPILQDWIQLGKPRITAMTTLSVLMGYFLSLPREMHEADLGYMLGVLGVGSTLLGWGIHSLNQWMERDIDRYMTRTRNRPLPAQRMRPVVAMSAGFVFTLCALGLLWIGAGWFTGWVGVVIVVSYLVLYTPMKQYSALNTLVGAIPGALPPVIGWSAVAGAPWERGLALFLIMFVWQQVHFFPIAWLYRNQYQDAGLVMLSNGEHAHAKIRQQMVLYSVLMITASLYPTMIGMAGSVYFVGAFLLSIVFIAVSMLFVWKLDTFQARLTLKASVIYLPLLFALMAYDLIAY